MQLRAQCADGVWSEWTPLLEYTISNADCDCGTTLSPSEVEELEAVDLSPLFHSADMSNINLYPNPANDILFVKQEFPEGGNIDVYNLQGQLLKSFSTIEEEITPIDISDLDAGAYVVKVIMDQQITSRRFIKL